MVTSRLAYLYQQYINKACTQPELEEFFHYLSDNQNRQQLNGLADQHLAGLDASYITEIDWNQVYQQILRKGQITKVVEFEPRKTNRIRWIAAACIIIIAGFILTERLHKKNDKQSIVQTPDIQSPANTRAVITLANGNKVYLDSAGNGAIAQQDNVTVVRNEKGEVIYDAIRKPMEGLSLVYNSLFNPRGSKVISLTLSDGTKVWLNSESSLKYPTVFTGNTREVEITGEAYFEVVKDPKKKFIVTGNGVSTEVLGTHFNVNNYADEELVRVTLLEGSVKTSMINGQWSILKPGEQSIADPVHHSPFSIHRPNLDLVMSWKNGTFSYNNSDLESIMRQMARWYDVDVIYKDKITDRYTVDVPRTVPASQLCKFIEMSGGVHFKIEGKKVMVSR